MDFVHARVGDLAQSASCPKRSKLQHKKLIHWGPSNARSTGTVMHKDYSEPFKSFDRRVMRQRLFAVYGRVHRRLIRRPELMIEVAGIPDDYRVLNHYEHGVLFKKTVSLVEVKTTSKNRLWINEKLAAIMQLQIYVWLLEPALNALGYALHPRHYLEMFHQSDGSLIQRLMVHPIPYMEEQIIEVVNGWHGLAKVHPPSDWVCKRCPRAVKSACDWFKMGKV